jgi:hypothetical protein
MISLRYSERNSSIFSSFARKSGKGGRFGTFEDVGRAALQTATAVLIVELPVLITGDDETSDRIA